VSAVKTAELIEMTLELKNRVSPSSILDGVQIAM